MIGQNVALPFLIPLAVEVLEHDALAEGDFYPGDLLATVLRVEREYWTNAPDFLERVLTVIGRLSDFPDELRVEVRQFLRQHPDPIRS
jgi:hypothetical protein